MIESFLKIDKSRLVYVLLFAVFFSVCTAGQAATADDERYLRKCFDLAVSAAEKGNHPFGAVLVYRGNVILTAENTVNTDNDHIHHAETNLMTKAIRKFPLEIRRQCTVYASTAPCFICSAALIQASIRKVVYGVSTVGFDSLTGYHEERIPYRELTRLTGASFEWAGPALEKEGLQVLRHWPPSDPNSRYFRKDAQNPKEIK
jgi:tRNA(Arg) A34 adenosine deaminase TadA